MKTKKKILMALAIVCCAILLVVGSVAGTVAYLTATDTVTNTFTVGNVAITMDETKVDAYGVAVDGAGRVKENTYKLIPGHSYTKDPVIHVQAGSEKSYLFVKITDEIAAIQDTKTIAEQLTANGWTLLDGDVWYHAAVDASASANDIDVKVFESIKIKNDAAVATYANKTIKVIAYAVQADGFTTAEAAWTATFGAP